MDGGPLEHTTQTGAELASPDLQAEVQFWIDSAQGALAREAEVPPCAVPVPPGRVVGLTCAPPKRTELKRDGPDCVGHEVTLVAKGGLAESLGVAPGWVLEAVDGAVLTDASFVPDVLARARGTGQPYELLFTTPAIAAERRAKAAERARHERAVANWDAAFAALRGGDAAEALALAKGEKVPKPTDRRSHLQLAGSPVEDVPQMTPEVLQRITQKDGYSSPELNSALYLHARGFQRIENLEPYVNLTGLFLHANGLKRLDNLSHLKKLKQLYLDDNCLRDLDGLGALPELMTLTVSGNFLTRVEASELGGLPKLTRLNLARNHLGSLEALEGLRACRALESLDVSENQIEGDSHAAGALLARVGALLHLVVKENPLTGSVRRSVIAAIPTLIYVDKEPVRGMERAASEAWARGEDVCATQAAYALAEQAQSRASLQAFRAAQASHRQLGTHTEGVPRQLDGACGDGFDAPTAGWEELFAHRSELQRKPLAAAC